MERNKTKRKENELTAELTTEVEKNKKEEEMTTATKTKQPKATKQPKPTQAKEEPTEEKFLSAKELAQMAGVTPTVLRKTLRSNFAGKIPRDKDGRQHRFTANDPIVEEIIAKVNASNRGKSPPASENKGVGDEPSPESLVEHNPQDCDICERLGDRSITPNTLEFLTEHTEAGIDLQIEGIRVMEKR